jgi:cobalamin synthase
LFENLYIDIKRLRDLNRNDMWVLLFIIPLFGEFMQIIACLWPGSKKANKFGERAKKITSKRETLLTITIVGILLLCLCIHPEALKAIIRGNNL